jgi:hypothetical protein
MVSFTSKLVAARLGRKSRRSVVLEQVILDPTSRPDYGPYAIRVDPVLLDIAQAPVYPRTGSSFVQARTQRSKAYRFLLFFFPGLLAVWAVILASLSGLSWWALGAIFLAAWAVIWFIIMVNMSVLEESIYHSIGVRDRRQALARDFGPKEAAGVTPRTLEEALVTVTTGKMPPTNWWVLIPEDSPEPLPLPEGEGGSAPL